MDDTRVHAMFIIGSDTLPEETLNQIFAGINTRFGGCTVTEARGCRSEDGEEFTAIYSNKVKFERAFQIDVSFMTDLDAPFTAQLDYLKGCFVPAKDFATWIHCEVWQTEAHHFNIKEIGEA